MRKFNALACLLVLFALTGSSFAGDLSPALSQQMAQNADQDPLTVLVVLHDGVDIRALDLSLHQQKTKLAVRHRLVIESLRDAASSAQAGLVADLAAAKSRGEIIDYRPYWIINAVRLTASEAVIREIAARLDVDVVEPNLVPELIEPVARRQADGLEDGNRGIGITPGVVNIGARRVWDELGIRGEGALIGSLDTGVDGNHPALADRWRGNHAPWQECWLDVVYGTYEFPTDLDGHGTHCTGTMTGLALDDTIGVAPAAEWIAANPIDHLTSSPDFDPDIIACFQWFADPDGNPTTLDDVPDVVQNSWGISEAFGYPDCDSRWWDAIDACEAAGPAVIFAAGNEGSNPSSLRSPADRATSLTNVFSVGATLHTAPYTIAGFSSRGPAGPDCGPEENRTKPEVSGPGVDIYSAESGGTYIYLDGTSMATPHVCGVVALMRSANPDIDVITIKEVLMGTSHDLGIPGEDNDYGHGFIDAYDAVTQVMSGFGFIEGLVTDAITGDPIPDAQVTLMSNYWTTTTDETGYYSLRAAAGSQVISVSTYSYEITNQPVMVLENETITENMMMSLLPRMNVTGSVYLPGGNPIDGGSPAVGATITIENVPEPAVIADADGRFSVSLPFGFDYQLSVTSGIEGYLTQTVPFYQDLELDLYLNAGNSDGFESGDLATFGWVPTGVADWTVQSDEVHSGNYAGRSGAIGDGQYAQIYAYVNCGEGGDILVWYKVSSEAGDDVLRLSIDNTVVGEWSGEVDWTQATFPVGSGTHIIRWRYLKGSSGSSGADAAWVDDMIFPGGADHVAKIVAAPVEVAVALDAQVQTSASGYILNMGLLDLDWSVSESADWLALSPTSGTLLPGTYQEITYDFDATGLMDGTYTALITVDSNDPANPVSSLQARMDLFTDISPVPEALPRTFALLGAVPNPFNPTTLVRFTLPASQQATLNLYDVRGRLVRTLIDEVRPAGLNEISWDGRDNRGRGAASGTYFARLKAGAQTDVKSLTLVR